MLSKVVTSFEQNDKNSFRKEPFEVLCFHFSENWFLIKLMVKIESTKKDIELVHFDSLKDYVELKP